MNKLIWVFGSFLTLIIIAIFGDYTHFTWWAATEFYIYTLMKIYDYGDHFVLVYLVQAFIVIVTIVGMSFLDCGLLTTAADEYGLLYIPLNFGVHYLPALIALLSYESPKNPSYQISVALSILAAYVSFINPAHIYNCNFSDSFPYFSVLSLASLLIAVTIAEGLIFRHIQRREGLM